MNTRVLSGAVIAIITLILTLSIVGPTGKAYSQMIPPLQMPQTKDVAGRYVNPDFGLEIVFPQGFTGYEIPVDYLSSKMVQLNSNTASISLTMQVYPGVQNTNPSSNESSTSCLSSAGCVKIGGKNAQVSSSETNMGGFFSKSKSYTMFLDPSRTISISYTAASASDYDSNLGKFEESLKTLKFTK